MWLFVLHVFLCWLLLLCSFNCRLWNRDFNVHGDEVGIMKILPIFCFKISNGIEGGGCEEMLNCTSRWIRPAGKWSGKSFEPRVLLKSTLLCRGLKERMLNLPKSGGVLTDLTTGWVSVTSLPFPLFSAARALLSCPNSTNVCGIAWEAKGTQ
jgi:hypothetical protein